MLARKRASSDRSSGLASLTTKAEMAAWRMISREACVEASACSMAAGVLRPRSGMRLINLRRSRGVRSRVRRRVVERGEEVVGEVEARVE